MSVRLPNTIEPSRLASEERHMEGGLPIAGLSRLAALLLNSSGRVEVELNFHIGAYNRPVIEGHIGATVEMQCQRCLEPVTLELASHLNLGVVRGPEEAAGLPAELDPVIIDGNGIIQLAEMIEDELLLALPSIPRHGSGECQSAEMAQGEQVVESVDVKEASPFAVLAELKRERDKD